MEHRTILPIGTTTGVTTTTPPPPKKKKQRKKERRKKKLSKIGKNYTHFCYTLPLSPPPHKRIQS